MVKAHKEALVPKTIEAVKIDSLRRSIIGTTSKRLEITEEAGKPMAKINSAGARQRADEFTERLKQRMAELEQELSVSPVPPTSSVGLLSSHRDC